MAVDLLALGLLAIDLAAAGLPAVYSAVDTVDSVGGFGWRIWLADLVGKAGYLAGDLVTASARLVVIAMRHHPHCPIIIVCCLLLGTAADGRAALGGDKSASITTHGMEATFV